MNCDSPEFLRLAVEPAFLLEEKNDRQSRPGMIVASHVISYPFKPFEILIDFMNPELKREAPERINKNINDYLPVFLSYALLNFILILYLIM
jgi:hypothetical protein